MAGRTSRKSAKVAKKAAPKTKTKNGLFNASLEGSTRRAIDFHEGDEIDETALKALIRAAVALNTSARAAGRPTRPRKKPQSG